MRKVLSLIISIVISINAIAQSKIDYASCLDAEWDFVEESIKKYGYDSPQAFAKFLEAKVFYDVNMEHIKCYYSDNVDSPILSYDEYLNLIQHWRNIILTIIDTYGYGYLIKLKTYCEGEESKSVNDYKGEQWSQRMHYYTYGESEPEKTDMDYYALSIDDEIKLNILSDNIAEYERNYITFLDYMTTLTDFYNNDTITKVIADEAFDISKMLARYGRHEEALGLLMGAYRDGVNKNIPLGLQERYCTKIASQAMYMGNRDIAQIMTFEAYTIVSKGEDFCSWISYDDINNFLEDLLVIIQLNYDASGLQLDENLALKYASMAAKVISEDRRGVNGKTVRPIIKSAVFQRCGLLYSVNGDYALGEKYYRDAIAIDGDLFFSLDAYRGLGGVLASQGKFDEAEEILLKCLDYGKEYTISCDRLMNIYNNLAYIAERKGNMKKFASYIDSHFEALKDFYVTTTSGMTNLSRQNFWESHSDIQYAPYIYTTAAEMCPLTNGTAYNALLFHKNILVRQSRIVERNIIESNDEEMKMKYQMYKEAVRAGKRNEAIKYEGSVMHLYSMHPEFRTSFQHQSWKNVQDNLNADDVAIEFSEIIEDTDTLNVTIVAFVVKRDYQCPKMIKICNERELDDLLRWQSSEGYPLAYSQNLNKNNVLYSMTWANLESELSGIKRIFFSPFGVLCQVNMEILGKKHNSARICDKYEVHRLSSTGQLCTNDNDEEYNSAILFGDLDYNAPFQFLSESRSDTTAYDRFPVDRESAVRGRGISWSPLKETGEEVDNINKALRSKGIKTVIVTKEQGTEDAFKRIDGNDCSILHLATHGFYYSDVAYRKLPISENDTSYISPLKRSGLIMAGGNHLWRGEDVPNDKEDGTLRAEEISGMDLSSTKLVVLSACQTGLGDMATDGVYGLQRGFKLAGVKTLIMSLWEVNSVATEMMMTTFYEHLMSGKSRHESFVKAQERVRKTYTKAYIKKNFSSDAPQDPEYYWASFIMVD